ncbi:PASTA domain-containing protein [Dactylosporangium sp. NPDC049525]|uniref:PASTA domain-containing protein n=1 Tax=Dactylosporangium sp. NPDC049525 TaxID=3154730 RepID=UPI0034206A23
MSTKWVVTTAAERIVLDDAKQGGTTFTVTNPGKAADRVVFEPVPGTDADGSWFTVDEPQRRVLPAASASFLLKVHVPADARPGAYEVQGRAYSADSAPEESSVLSGRVVFDVAAPPAPQKRRIPWWIIAIAAALVVITVVTVTLVLTLGGGEDKTALPAASATAAAPTSGPVPVPDLARLNETQALFALKQAGLVAGTIKHKQDPSRPDTVIEQSVAAAKTVAAGTAVDLVVAVKLSPPVLKTPPNEKLKQIDGRLVWEQPEAYVTRWLLSMSETVCVQGGAIPYSCLNLPVVWTRTDTKSYAPSLRAAQALGLAPANAIVSTTGAFIWTVSAVDDFGGSGPTAVVLPAQMVP